MVYRHIPVEPVDFPEREILHLFGSPGNGLTDDNPTNTSFPERPVKRNRKSR
jgi:hypothetical protein